MLSRENNEEKFGFQIILKFTLFILDQTTDLSTAVCLKITQHNVYRGPTNSVSCLCSLATSIEKHEIFDINNK